MPSTFSAIAIMVFLSPGFLGYFIFSKIYSNRIQDNFEKISYIFIFNTLSFMVYYFVDFAGLSNFLRIQEVAPTDLRDFLLMAGLPLIVFSSLIAIVFASLANSNKLQKVLLEVGVTNVSGHGSVLTDVIKNNPDSFFKVILKDGTQIIGHPSRYSLFGDENFLFLRKSAYRSKSQNAYRAARVKEVDGPGVLLLGFQDILFVEVMDGVSS